MKLTIDRKGKIVEAHLFLIVEKLGKDTGDDWIIVDRQYLHENSMIVMEPYQQAVFADDEGTIL